MTRVDGVAVDANLLVLLVVGLTSRDYIAKHKNCISQAFDADAFELLTRYLVTFPKMVCTPNTLTETTNLAAQIGDPIKTRILGSLHALICEGVIETYVESRTAAMEPEFLRLGLTDCGLLTPGFESYTLLTVDAGLYTAALARGRTAVNFNHIRELAWQQH